MADIKWGGRVVKIGSMYAPSDATERVKFFTEVRECGLLTRDRAWEADLNCVPDKVADAHAGYADNRGADIFEDAAAAVGLEDTWRREVGDAKIYTRYGQDSHHPTRIDRWLTPHSTSQQWTCDIDAAFNTRKGGSDHEPITATLTITSKEQRGKDRLRIDPRLLEIPHIIENIRAMWTSTLIEFPHAQFGYLAAYAIFKHDLAMYLLAEGKKRYSHNTASVKTARDTARALEALHREEPYGKGYAEARTALHEEINTLTTQRRGISGHAQGRDMRARHQSLLPAVQGS